MSGETKKVVMAGREFTRGEISRGTGVSLSHISRIFSGDRVPSVPTVAKIAEWAGVSDQDVLDVIRAAIRGKVREIIGLPPER